MVELGSPELDEQQNTVRFPAEVLDEATGNLSHLASDLDQSVEASFGPATLFIDDTTGEVINGCPIQPNTQLPRRRPARGLASGVLAQRVRPQQGQPERGRSEGRPT